MPQAGAAVARARHPGSSELRPVAERVDDFFECYSTAIIATFTVLFATASIVIAIRQRLWLDEIYSVFMLRQPSVADMIRASYAGAEQQAPLYVIVARWVYAAIPNNALALRLPSIAGFCTMAVCTFALVRKQIGALYALMATLISVCALLYYATEGRCYGLVLGFTALTLLCWQRAGFRTSRRGAWLAGMIMAGALAVATQYFSVFFLGALFAAQVVHGVLRRRLDIPMLAAICAPLFVIVPHLPLIRAARPLFQHFWSPASIHSITSFYDTFLAQDSWVLVAAIFFYALAHFGRDPRPAERGEFSSREWIAYALISITPAFSVLFTLLTVKVYAARYTLWAVPAIAICVAAGLHYVSRGSRLAPISAILALCMLLGVHEAGDLHAMPHLRSGQTTLEQIESLPPAPTPVLVANHQVYIEVWYYSSPQIRRRLYYGIDPEADIRYGWPDTGPAVLKVLRHWTQIQAPDLGVFLSRNAHFLVAADGRDWLVTHLLLLGYQLKPIRTTRTAGLEGLSVVYEASRTGS